VPVDWRQLEKRTTISRGCYSVKPASAKFVDPLHFVKYAAARGEHRKITGPQAHEAAACSAPRKSARNERKTQRASKMMITRKTATMPAAV
jgi:hypothetical protein